MDDDEEDTTFDDKDDDEDGADDVKDIDDEGVSCELSSPSAGGALGSFEEDILRELAADAE